MFYFLRSPIGRLMFFVGWGIIGYINIVLMGLGGV